jgi:hypothetical protein
MSVPAPDPTYMHPGLGWTEQNKHRISSDPPAAEIPAPEPEAAEQPLPARPGRGRPARVKVQK